MSAQSKEIARLLDLGLTFKEIAQRLGVTPAVVAMIAERLPR